MNKIYSKFHDTINCDQDEERAVCVCLNPFDVIAVALARHLFIGAPLIIGDVPEVRGDIQRLVLQIMSIIWSKSSQHSYPEPDIIFGGSDLHFCIYSRTANIQSLFIQKFET